MKFFQDIRWKDKKLYKLKLDPKTLSRDYKFLKWQIIYLEAVCRVWEGLEVKRLRMSSDIWKLALTQEGVP